MLWQSFGCPPHKRQTVNRRVDALYDGVIGSAAMDVKDDLRPKAKRRRRTPEQAREEVLEAAERILVSTGSRDIKFQTIAKEAGISQSNIHHHFGGIEEIKIAILQRVATSIMKDLWQLLQAKIHAENPHWLRDLIERFVEIGNTDLNINTVAWIIASGRIDNLTEMRGPGQAAVTLVSNAIAPMIGAEKARMVTPKMLYLIAIHVTGHGMIGQNLFDALLKEGEEIASTEMLISQVEMLIEEAA